MNAWKRFAALCAALTLTAALALPAAAEEIEVTEDITVSGDYDWTRFAGDNITLNVYNWGLYISDGSDDSVNVLSAFEELTGIKVNYTTFDSNESLYAKMKSGGASYDVIFPSEYMVGKMAAEGMLAELNYDNIPNIANVGEEDGTGYLFESYDAGAMLDVIGQATGLYRGDRKGFDTVRHRGMTADFSWARSAGEYRRIYGNLLG